MSLWSKLLKGDKDAEKEVKDLLTGIFGNARPEQKKEEREEAATPEASAEPSAPVSDDPWETVPAEENQYNYQGTYEQYFEHIFAEDFPAWRYEKSYLDNVGKHSVIYTFFGGPGKALVVELMTESSEAVKFRNDCRKAGTPYLRFYYDHEGWWNTRSYVVGRLRSVLLG